MPSFDFPALVWWGLPLAAAPVLIHLINLLRHRRVHFAALEFLLASQRKYRTRVLLKQILLLLLRTLAVLGLVLALAQPRWTSGLAGLLGGGQSRHVVLLDDSYSTSDRSAAGRGRAADDEAGAGPLGDTTPFDRGRAAVERIAGDLAAMPVAPTLAVARYSKLASGTAAATARCDVPPQLVTPQAVPGIRDELGKMTPSALDTGPHEPLRAAEELLGVDRDTPRVLWLVSDFRGRDWQAPAETATLLRRLVDAGVALRFVDCGPYEGTGTEAGNLTIERLEAVGGVPARGVLVPMEVTVRNDGDRPVRELPVTLREDGAARPGLQVAEIPPGGQATARFEARFDAAGGHVIEATLPADAVADDNARTAVVDIVDHADVLLIDGDPRGGGRAGDAFYVAAALAPGAGAPTGLRPRIEPPRSLATLELNAFDSIWILDVERLDQPEITALEAYARGGGGVVFFTGPRTRAENVSALFHRGGEGLFPVPLAGPVDLPPPPAGGGVPDITAGEHPVVAVLAGQRNPLLDAVRIERVMAVPRGYEPPAEEGLRRLLSLRTGAALAVERPFGAGLVAAVLTTAAPTWNNWARGNPSWVVVMLELESHLARARRRVRILAVGDPLAVRLEPGSDEIDVDFTLPSAAVIRQTATTTPDGGLEARLPAAETAGSYVAGWHAVDGTPRRQFFAVNVNPAEGRLERIGREGLARGLGGVGFVYERADALEPRTGTGAGTSLVRPLLAALLAVLAAEQLLAFLAGYHPAAKSPATPRSPSGPRRPAGRRSTSMA